MNTVLMNRLITLTNQMHSMQEEIRELKALAQEEEPKHLQIMRIEKGRNAKLKRCDLLDEDTKKIPKY